MNPAHRKSPSFATSTSRRRFLKTAAVGTTAVTAFPAILSARSPNEKLDIAMIGVGGRGARNMKEVEGENIVALCDVDARHLDSAAKKHPGAKRYRDFRQVFDDADRFDAVIVSTTEHTHAFAVLPALQLGKHVYCEKPLSRDVFEARVLTKAAKNAGVATQMGTQIHASDNYRRVVELIQSKAIGSVTEVHVWVSRAWGWQSQREAEDHSDIVWTMERPKEAMTPPTHLDWDLWLGPAPWRPYHDVYFPGPKWYRWWDFGNGTMSDLGSHWNDLPFWALNLDAPLTIEAFGPPPHPEIAPASMSATYEYGPRDDRPGLTLTWHQGAHKPPIWHEGGIPQWKNGILFIGSDGMLLSDYRKYVLLPESTFADLQPPDPWIPKSLGHHAEWVHACKTGAPTLSHFGYAGPLTEANHLGNVAYRAGKKLHWDAENMKATHAPEADPFLKRTYRAGWSLA